MHIRKVHEGRSYINYQSKPDELAMNLVNKYFSKHSEYRQYSIIVSGRGDSSPLFSFKFRIMRNPEIDTILKFMEDLKGLVDDEYEIVSKTYDDEEYVCFDVEITDKNIKIIIDMLKKECRIDKFGL